MTDTSETKPSRSRTPILVAIVFLAIIVPCGCGITLCAGGFVSSRVPQTPVEDDPASGKIVKPTLVPGD